MAEHKVNARIKLRRDLLANYNNEFVPLSGEVCLIETAIGVRVKVGDGTTNFGALPFLDDNIYNELTDKQDKLTAGANITISDDGVISASVTGEGGGELGIDVFVEDTDTLVLQEGTTKGSEGISRDEAAAMIDAAISNALKGRY